MRVTWNSTKNNPSSLGLRFISRAILGSFLLIGITLSANEVSAWTLTADFESGTVGKEAEGASGFHAAGNRTTFSNERPHSGSQSAKFSWLKGDVHSQNCKGIFNFPSQLKEGQEIWARGYFYFRSPWSWGQLDQSQADVIKVIRFHQRQSDGSHVGMLSAMEQNKPGQVGEPWVGNEGGTLQDGVSRSGTLLQNKVSPPLALGADTWYSIEVYSKFHNTEGIVRLWIDGVLVLEYTKLNTARNVGNFYDEMFWMSFWNGGPAQDQVQYIDDIVVTTNRPLDRDAQGNPMIGLQPLQTDTKSPQPPTGLRIN